MPNQRLADRYAKSLVDLATEQNVLDTTCADMKLIKALGGASSELVSILKSPIFHVDQKNKILHALTDGKVSVVTSSFLHLLVKFSYHYLKKSLAQHHLHYLMLH